MATTSLGSPCWADAMFTDLEGAKDFYGAVLGWTFADAMTEYGGYTEAYADGKAVAAVVPPMPGQEEQSSWCLYFASPDVAATATRIQEQGGALLIEPMQVAEFGTMCLAHDPAGVTFGVWQAGTHKGFEVTDAPGAFVWAEVLTRDPERTDAFFTRVFPYETKRVADPEMDFRVYQVDGQPMIGRMAMTPEHFPPEVPQYIQLYFSVPNCDAAIAMAQELGATVVAGPMDTPFGRFASLIDPQGAPFAVIDTATTAGEMPPME